MSGLVPDSATGSVVDVRKGLWPRTYNTAATSRAATTAATPATGRLGLDRGCVLAAAVDFVDEWGLRRLTMRALVKHLSVSAMALYRHVHDREDLLDGIVETVLDEITVDPCEPGPGRSGDWRETLRRLAHGMRRVALAHPQFFPLVATRALAAPWVRPPLSLRLVESFLDTTVGQGLSPKDAVNAYRAFSSFLHGPLLLEVSALGVDTGPVEEVGPRAGDSSDLRDYPRLQSLQDDWVSPTPSPSSSHCLRTSWMGSLASRQPDARSRDRRMKGSGRTVRDAPGGVSSCACAPPWLRLSRRCAAPDPVAPRSSSPANVGAFFVCRRTIERSRECFHIRDLVFFSWAPSRSHMRVNKSLLAGKSARTAAAFAMRNPAGHRPAVSTSRSQA